MNRVDGEQPLCREKGLSYLPPVTPLSSASNMRALHSEASAHDRLGPFASAPCLTPTGTAGARPCSRRGAHASTFLSSFPQSGFASRSFSELPRNGTTKILTPARLTRRAGLPAYCTTPSCRSVSNPVGLPDHRLPPRQRVQRVSDFAMNEQARRSSPPNRVRHPTDQQFALGCSPPRLAATQLPSATELWLPPTRTFTVLMWRPHRRTHSRMPLAGIHLCLIHSPAPTRMPAGVYPE